MALVPQGRRVFPSLTVRENLEVAARGGGGPLEPRARATTLFPRLRERAANRANKLSGGEQQMLAIGRALMTNPELLLMDEPTEGLAPLLVREVGRVIGSSSARGSRSCSSSRTCRSRFGWPTACTCSRAARSSTRRRPESSGRTTR